MNNAELEEYLHSNIPITKAMQVGVVEIGGNRVILSAPLLPNTNHRDTAFGGSLSTLAILSAWSLLRLKMDERNAKNAHLVIQRQNVEYLHPAVMDFTASAMLANEDKWQRFEKVYAAKGKARISVQASVEAGGKVCARFVGDFVVLASP
ncbi:MAG: thioesterase domain-containing protein [Devosiaceae bacterium]|nr:thioesterase domain-containing protein [Devosiaceae bacterium]